MGRLSRIVGLVAVTLPLFAASAGAQRTEMPCWEEGQQEGEEEACNAARAERLRALYDVPALEELRRDGVQVRRVFYVDNQGWDAGALSFTRAPGQPPRVSFQRAPRDGERPAPLVADLPAEIWDQAVVRSEYFDRSYAPAPPAPPTEDEVICLHGWGYYVEASDPAWLRRPATLRRRVDSACTAESPAPEYARALADMAVALFPACMALEQWHHGLAIRRLNACAQLSGDRLAAAEVRNALHPLLELNDRDGFETIRPVFAAAARLDWDGASASGLEPAARLWLRRFREHRYAVLGTTRIHGETQDRVLVDGFVAYQTLAGEAHRAPVEMIFSSDDGDMLTLERASVGPYRPDPPQ